MDLDFAGESCYSHPTMAKLYDFSSPEQEHRDFEAGAEDMEARARRMEAEEDARREAAMEAERPTFKEAMKMAKDAMAKMNYGSASGLAWEALCEAEGPGQKRLAEALLRAVDRALDARRE